MDLNATRSISEVFAAVSTEPDLSIRASLLLDFGDRYTLDWEQHPDIVQEMASWIYSDHDELRRIVAVVLCMRYRICQAACVAIEGWKRSSLWDLNWYSSAIKGVYATKEQVQLQTILAITDDIENQPPRRFALPQMQPYELDDAQRVYARELMRVLAHFAALFEVGYVPRDVDEIDWAIVAKVLLNVIRQGALAAK